MKEFMVATFTDLILLRRAGHRPFQGAGRDGRVVRMADRLDDRDWRVPCSSIAAGRGRKKKA